VEFVVIVLHKNVFFPIYGRTWKSWRSWQRWRAGCGGHRLRESPARRAAGRLGTRRSAPGRERPPAGRCAPVPPGTHGGGQRGSVANVNVVTLAAWMVPAGLPFRAPGIPAQQSRVCVRTVDHESDRALIGPFRWYGATSETGC
jgi:hypothetical protein